MTESKFAPTPMHGAAYAVVIEQVGGANEIGGCHSGEVYARFHDKLDAIRRWSDSQPENVRAAYHWGITKVDADLRGRLELYDNRRRVTEAMSNLPKPE